MGSGASSCDRAKLRGANGRNADIFWEQLQAPLDASDLTSVPEARQMMHDLRFCVARMNQHVMAHEIVNKQGNCITLDKDVRVPMQAPKKTEAPMLAKDLMHGLRRLGVDLNEFLASQEGAAVGSSPKNDSKFVDTEFPPEASSLAETFDTEDVRDWEKYTWERLFEFYKLFGDNNEVAPTDVQQGNLGDCYLLSSLSCLAEHPKRIRDLFVLDDVPSGCVGVRLCLHGEWQTIMVDDLAPYDEGTSDFAFAHPPKNGGAGVWSCLVEKAWAKVCGTYAGIAGGDAGNALEMLTGCYTERFETDDPATVWRTMLDAESQGFVMTATIYDRPGDLQASVGLVEMHAYTVLGVHALRMHGRTLKLVRIRNPWGSFEWKGDWSDNSALWTDEIRREVGWTNENDGIFFMDLNDFSKTFSAVHVGYLRPGDVRVNTAPALFCVPEKSVKRHKVENVLLPKRRACFQLAVPAAGAYTLGVHQRDRGAVHGDEGADADFAAVRMWVVKLGGDSSTVASSSFTIAKDVYIPSADLAEGDYYVFVAGHGIPAGAELSFTLSVNGPGKASIEALHTGVHASNPTHEKWRAISDAMAENYHEWALSEGTVSSLAEFGQPDIKMYVWTSALAGVLCMAYENKGDRTVVESVDFNLENLFIVRTGGNITTQFNTTAEITLQPGEDGYILMEQHDPSTAYSYSYSRSISLEG